MDEILLELLISLEAIGEEHPELYDTACREDMADPIFDGFISADPNSSPYTFGKRLTAFQNPEVATPNGLPYDDFFGYTDPADYDEAGN